MYEINVNSEKNRIYITLDGHIPEEDAQNMLDEVKEKSKTLRDGFTKITNVLGFKPKDKKLFKYFQEVQKYLYEKGASCTVRIAEGRVLYKLFEDGLLAQNITQITIQAPSVEEAELFLQGYEMKDE